MLDKLYRLGKGREKFKGLEKICCPFRLNSHTLVALRLYKILSDQVNPVMSFFIQLVLFPFVPLI